MDAAQNLARFSRAMAGPAAHRAKAACKSRKEQSQCRTRHNHTYDVVKSLAARIFGSSVRPMVAMTQMAGFDGKVSGG